MKLWIDEKHVDTRQKATYNAVDWHETRWGEDQVKDLFKSLCQEYGRASTQWTDTPSGGRKRVGWVFQKRVEYDDVPSGAPRKDRIYLREVWIRVSVGDPRQPTPPPAIRSPWATDRT